MAIFTLISIILWIVYFLVTVLVGNATIATLIFIVYWICSTWIVSLEHLYYITGKKETNGNVNRRPELKITGIKKRPRENVRKCWLP